jgi:hypothetical protein
LQGGYKPELDDIPDLDPIRANFYHSHIGVLRWCVEFGHIAIITEVSMLSTYLCMPREVHLEAVFEFDCTAAQMRRSSRVSGESNVARKSVSRRIKDIFEITFALSIQY